jgi:hypothetical protein
VSDLYAVGQPIRLSTTVEDIAGAATDPTGLSLVLKASDGTLTTLTYPGDIVRESAGNFHYDFTTATAGHWRYKWVSTGTAAGVGPNPGPGVFDVADPFGDTHERLVSLADAKAFLRLSGTADDALLDRIVGWASARIMREVVAVPTTVTETVTACDGWLRLSRTPVRSVTSVTGVDQWAPLVPVAGLVVAQPLAGLVRASTGPAPCGTYTVVYEAGYDEIPPGVDGATLQLIRHWWNQSQAHGSSTYGDGGFVPDFDSLPNVVRNMLGTVPRRPLVG